MFLVTVVSLVPLWLFITHVAQPRMSEKGALFGCSVREGPRGVDVAGESRPGGSASRALRGRSVKEQDRSSGSGIHTVEP